MSELRFVFSPANLPRPPKSSRVALVDVAFAHGSEFRTVTTPFLEELGDRLVAWVDHHDHPAWPRFADDPRFCLVDKRNAPACPELIDPALVARVGSVDVLYAHADFDGCLAAVKWLRGGRSAYPGADEDARAVDAPGHGYVLSPRGERLAHAIDHARKEGASSYGRLLARLSRALVEGDEGAELEEELDRRAREQEAAERALSPILRSAESPHPEIRMVRVRRELTASDRKYLLRKLEEEATIALIEYDEQLTVATFHDDVIDLTQLPGMKGQRGYVWGRAEIDEILSALVDLLPARE